MRPEARHRGRLGGRRLDREPLAARRSPRRARQRGRHRDFSLAGEISVGSLGHSLHPAARGLASCLAADGERPTMGAISSKGTANMSCSTNASRSEGPSVSSTTSSARPTESASRASCAGSIRPPGSRSGRARARPEAPRAATCASAACQGTPARRPSSAIRPDLRRHQIGAGES